MTGKLPYICGFTVLNLLLGTLVYASPIIVEGERCDRSEFVQSCDGDKLFVCSDIEGVIAHDCSRQNKTCADFGGNSERFMDAAVCLDDEDICDNEGEIVRRERTLNSGKSLTYSVQCEKTTDDRLYYRKLRREYDPVNIEKQAQREQVKAEMEKKKSREGEDKGRD